MRKNNKKIFTFGVVLAVLLVIIYTAAGSPYNDYSYFMTEQSEIDEYEFIKIDDEEKIWGTYKICDIYVTYDTDGSALAYGQMLTLFGEPLYTTANLENQYSYVIYAKKADGYETYLNVYSGPSGPSVGGSDGDEEAAAVLAAYIRSAAPTDYEYVGYYMDVPCKVVMGVKDGQPYMNEEILDLTEAEFVALYERLYGLE